MPNMQKNKINKTTPANVDEIFQIPPYLIKPNPSLARTDFSDTGICSLADSIRRYGILQPLAVRLSENGRCELVAGERRLRAATLLGLSVVPCVMLQESDNFEYLSVVENIQREKLNMFDEARAIARLFNRSEKDLAKTAKLLSISVPVLERKLKLTKFSRAEMQAILRLGTDEQIAVLFLELPQYLRYYAIKLCAEKGFSKSETERLCKKIVSSPNLTPDELEAFAEKVLQKPFSLAAEEPVGKTAPTILLRDLQPFKNSIEKSCKILNNAGYATETAIVENSEETIFTITVKKEKSK